MFVSPFNTFYIGVDQRLAFICPKNTLGTYCFAPRHSTRQTKFVYVHRGVKMKASIVSRGVLRMRWMFRHFALEFKDVQGMFFQGSVALGTEKRTEAQFAEVLERFKVRFMMLMFCNLLFCRFCQRHLIFEM